MGQLCLKTGTKLPSLQSSVLSALLQILEKESSISDEAGGEIISAAFRSLHVLANENKTIFADKMTQLLQIIHRNLFPHRRSKTPSTSAKPLRASNDMAWRRRSHAGSDSEMSDREATSPGSIDYSSRVIVGALNCLQSLAKSHPKLVFPKWKLFLSDFENSLFTFLSPSYSAKVRIAVDTVLVSFLESSKPYLSMAEGQKGPKTKPSFTSFSESLSGLLQYMHNELLKELLREENVDVLLSHIKCVTALVKSTPYDRLHSDLRSTIYNASLAPIEKPDNSIKAAILELQAALFDAGLLDSNKDYFNLDFTMTVVTSACASNLHDDASVKIASCDLLSALVRNRPKHKLPMWTRLKDTVDLCLSSSPDLVRVAALKILEQVCASGTKQGAEVEEGQVVDVESVRGWWADILRRHIPEDVLDSSESLCICVGLILEGIRDVDSHVRSAALRALGDLVTLAPFKENHPRVVAIAELLPTITSDSNLSVRISGSWALANFCDTLEDIKSNEVISLEVAANLLKAAIFYAIDNDKCRSNGVRAIGHVFSIAPPELVNHEIENLVKEAVLAIMKNIDSGAVKTRWNAAHAAGKILHSANTAICKSSWQTSFLDSLSTVIANSKNFKVRINAAFALRSLRTIDSYGGNVATQQLLKKLKDARDKASDLTGMDYGEYRYGEQFEEQLDQTIAHIAGLLV
ncbi:HEAT repeat-containing protein 6 [Blyttiomyces sp. JEL0837]|nr:HEAT repeat-containing protein 6 [Blyttiomyces sp. JEL0837]